jgi:myo-inositol-1(or 4)-monophosphatase
MNNNALTLAAVQAALKAGDILRRGFGSSFQISSKPGRHNLVTEYDNAAEKAIIQYIKSLYPDHGFLAEESGPTGSASAPVLWIIDPLDGTVNFAHQIPMFSVSIAAAIQGEVVSGVVYNPLVNELFVAEKGKGAFLNGTRIQVTANKTFDESLIATGFPYNVEENPHHCIDSFTQMLKLGIPLRRLGSAAIDLAYVASGRFDAFYEVMLYPWDAAAGKLLVEEAGGKVTHWDGSIRKFDTKETLLATNGHLHQQMVSQLGKQV